ncbi:RMD1 family protein [Aurantivibrio plasticivorans]
MNISANGKIDTLVIGRELQRPDAEQSIAAHGDVARYRDVCHLTMREGEAWVFDYGVLILWGVPDDEKAALLQSLKPTVTDPLEKTEGERFRYVVTDGEARLHQDVVYLPNNHSFSRLAFSHAFAQSIKLSVFEELAYSEIKANASIPSGLAESGKIPLNRRELAKRRGRLFSTKSDILLHFNLLDTPEFFWDYPELESMYLIGARYLDVIPRVNLLSTKLETMHELLEVLANEQNHKHASFLEWIIIVLIAVDIIVYFGH